MAINSRAKTGSRAVMGRRISSPFLLRLGHRSGVSAVGGDPQVNLIARVFGLQERVPASGWAWAISSMTKKPYV
jgi:hypothetical protein